MERLPTPSHTEAINFQKWISVFCPPGIHHEYSTLLFWSKYQIILYLACHVSFLGHCSLTLQCNQVGLSL